MLVRTVRSIACLKNMLSSPHIVYDHTHRALHCMPEEHAFESPHCVCCMHAQFHTVLVCVSYLRPMHVH
jgi:hypothetical protein